MTNRDVAFGTAVLVDRRDQHGLVRQQRLDDLPDEALVASAPIRDFTAWPGQSQRFGGWWSSSTRTHVPVTSRAERDLVIRLDFLGGVVAIGWRPFEVVGTRELPSYLAVRFGLRPAVLAVRGTAASQRGVFAGVAHDRGWQLIASNDLDDVAMANLRWLAAFRLDRYAPDPELRERLLSGFARPTSLRRGLARVTRQVPTSRDAVLGAVYHLLWCRALETPELAHVPLSMESALSASEGP